MERLKHLLCVLAVTALLSALAAPPALAQARPDEGGFTVSNYDIAVVVSEDNSYAVTETISVDFSEPRHGIYREIPLSGAVTRASGGEGFFKAAISEVAVKDVPFELTEDNGIASIRIGSADSTVEGPQTYRLRYRLQFADDGEAGFDEVYLNLIGNGWGTDIKKATFTVTLPASVDRNAVGFSIGRPGESGNAPSDLEVAVDGNIIRGETLRVLEAKEGLALRVELPQGTFAAVAAPQPEVVLPNEPVKVEEPPVQWSTDRPESAGRASGFLVGGGAALVISAIIALVVLAVRRFSGMSGGFSRPGFDPTRDELWRMNQMNQINQMHHMDHMDQQNTTSADFSSFNGGDSGSGGDSTGGGGSW